MYLSKLILNPRCREARRDVGSPYELHRTLVRAFETEPGTDYRARHGVLFRLEPLAYGAALPTVLVQSVSVPDWHELPEAYLLREPESKPLNLAFSIGQTLAFRLMANPTKKEKRPGQRQGRRVALIDTAEGDELTPARAWLNRKGDQNGFRVLYTTTDAFWLGSNRPSIQTTKQNLPLYGVRYDGLLQITDPRLVKEAMQQGVGPAKAFGFGLLSLACPR